MAVVVYGIGRRSSGALAAGVSAVVSRSRADTGHRKAPQDTVERCLSCAPYHPMTKGKIERYHRSLKNGVTLEHYYTPREVERAVGGFAEECNHRRYHEALQNVTPADMFFGRQATILARRARIKQRTLQRRKRENL